MTVQHAKELEERLGPMVWYFVKFFEQESYADAFMAGSLYLNTLAYFKRLESSTDGRMDSTEALAMWLQPDDLVIDIQVPGIGSAHITKTDLAAPVSVAYSHHDFLHILCLYAVYADGFECGEGGKIYCAPDQADEVRRQLTIDEQCLNFGKFAVITSAGLFINQIRAALNKQGYRGYGKLVEYYDDATFHGTISAKDAPFRKQKRFGYQREFRICVEPRMQSAGPLSISIGSLAHFSAKVASSDLSQLFKIKFEDAPAA
jgi:hypothetical protein